MSGGCVVPGCANTAFDFGVCWPHRYEELKAGGTPSAYELDRMRQEIGREEDERKQRIMVENSAPLKIDDEGWDGHSTRYGRKAMEGILRDVVESADGRNNTLFRCTARAAGLSAGGHVQMSVVTDAMTRAGEAIGLPRDEVRHCVQSAIRAGQKNPWGPKDG